MSTNIKCSKCANDWPGDKLLCDMCYLPIHSSCVGILKAEKACLLNKNRKINFFCGNCDIVKILGALKGEIAILKAEVDELKNNNRSNSEPTKNCLEELIDELEGRQRGSNNLILANVIKSDKEIPNQRKVDDFTKCE
ncbi:hypothetical protein Zmor_013538 [Zophobas morio]|uniref:Zinc finger PHD-type domain-containing protein n=1 Tax=Zophobas morio TaxID=2755281 RepID=A0AA38IDP5_9CUCU|nr:hypothetical protein Zmor_013538 [Zophobas morio]